MNWIYSLIVLQCTILLLHARPETSSLSPVATVGMESSQPAIQTSQSVTSSVEIAETPASKMHLTTNVAAPSTKRLLVTSQVKKVEPIIKKVTKAPELVTFSTVSVDADSKTTRYHHVDNHTNDTLHANQLTVHNAGNYNNYTNSIALLNNTSLVRTPINGSSRQYLGNVYTYNPYYSQALTTPKSVETILSSQPSYFVVNNNEIGAISTIETGGNIYNVEHALGPHVINAETYQVPRPLTVNIPYHQFPTASPPLLHNAANITKLYSIIGSSTPDPYTNYHALQTPQVKRKVVKISVTTHRTINKSTGNQQKQKNPNKYNKYPNHNDNKFSEIAHFTDSKGNLNKISIFYNESNHYFTIDDNKKPNKSKDKHKHPTDVDKLAVNKNETKNHTSSKNECVITPNAQGESVCNSNDLKIIIKFDGGNQTEKSVTTPKPKKRKTTTRAPTTTTPAPTTISYEEYEDFSYENSETTEQYDEIGGFLEPIQNLFGLNQLSRDRNRRRRRRRKRPTKDKDKDKDKKRRGNKDKDEVINKFQTIILQSPPPPTTTTAPEPSHKNYISKWTLYKLLAMIPIFGVVKPLLFGLWTIVLSPLLVIAIGGLALGVILYPFLAISRKQIYYASTQRSPRIVVHKHPTPRYKYNRLRPTTGIRIAKWNSAERRMTAPNRRRINGIQRKRIIPIRRRQLQQANKRRTRDTQFQQWLLIQNNFNIRIMSPNHDYDY